MKDVYWFHPQIGVWQTEGQPAQRYVAAYPAGTIQIPAPAGEFDTWDAEAGAWIAGTAPAPEPPVLDPARFEFLLALTGFGDVWDQLEAAAKAGGDMAQFAALKAERKRKSFQLDRTLRVVAQFRPVAAQIAPDTDLSDEAIRTAWTQAAAWRGIPDGS